MNKNKLNLLITMMWLVSMTIALFIGNTNALLFNIGAILLVMNYKRG